MTQAAVVFQMTDHRGSAAWRRLIQHHCRRIIDLAVPGWKRLHTIDYVFRSAMPCR